MTYPTTWDLSDLYPSQTSKELKDDIASLQKQAVAFSETYTGKVSTLSAEALTEAIKSYENIEELAGKIAAYAYLQYALNMSDETHTKCYSQAMEALNESSTHLLFFMIEINEIDSDTINQMLVSSDALFHYSPWLRDIRIYKPFQLSTQLEQVFQEKSLTSNNMWQRLFDETLADMRFTFEGETVTIAEILNALSSQDAEKRKEAGQTLGNELGSQSKLFTMITNVLAKDKSIEDKWRGYTQPISSRNVSNFIEDDVVDALLGSVQESYSSLSHKYYAWKAKQMGKDVIDYWDRNAPLPDVDSSETPYDEAVDLVLDAYASFSPRLRTEAEPFFEHGWVDVYPSEGKDSGAFAHPVVPSAHPYLMLNYQGKTRDIMTLAHELGHGVHQRLAAKQGALMADTPLTLAETASVFGEQLAFQEILKRERDSKKKQMIIAGKIEDMLNTVVRQVAFCQFERDVHDARAHGELSAEQIGDIWMKVQQDSLGPAIRFHDEYRHYWSYIPHFIHSPFYVYAYAFGDCLVNALYARYQEGLDGFEDKYFTMLEAGGTLHHKELLKPFDLDASDPEFWKMGLNVIASMIDSLED